MTPKEKASELIVNYQLQCKSLDYNEAKQCALILADEMIQETKTKFWYDVKHEIENL